MKSLALNLCQNIALRRQMLWLLFLLVSVATATAVVATTPAITSSATYSSRRTATTATTPSPSPTASSAASSSRSIISARNRQSALRTTTAVAPSLAKPPQLSRRRFSASTTTETIAAASTKPPPARGQRQHRRRPTTRQQHAAPSPSSSSSSLSSSPPSSSEEAIMTSTSASLKPVIIGESSTLASTRLVRHVDATTPQQGNHEQSQNVRQQRSFHSRVSNGQSFDDVDSRRKHKATQRGQHARATAINDEASNANENARHRNQRFRTPLRQQRYNNNNNKQSSTATLFDGGRPSKSATASDDALKDRKVTTTVMFPGNETDVKFTILHNQQTPKTPRMIQRLVAGHIQNNDAASSASSESKKVSVTSNQEVKDIGQRIPAVLSSSYRDHKLNANIRIDTTTAATSTESSIPKTTIVQSDYRDDDAALLDDAGDFDNWDNGILRLSAGSGKEDTLKPKKGKDEGKKTLADQVKDGKYGLIEKELFRRTPKRPGVLSYLPNKEVPEDNERNYGGLNEEDIWLAEDHLLVIKGGSLNEDNPNEPWPAIDDYNAAGRQIKIPDNPKVPPPFPVQLEKNGPIQLIGNNKLTVVYPVANESPSIYAADNTASESDSDDEKNLITRPGKIKTTQENDPTYNYPPSSVPWLHNNQTSKDPSLKPINFPILGPFLYGRNGSLDNSTDDFDEDDPSLYYPPPYSFVYKSNYTNAVPPGPLVPGIVVPPPPDQFTRLRKPDSDRRPGGGSTPIRYRVYSTTTTTVPPPVYSTPSTTTTTTTTTTQSPYSQGITRITQYTPKVIHIASPSPRPVYRPTASPAIGFRLQPTPSPTPSPPQIEPVPVPVAVPIPIYPVNVEPTLRPNVLSFVPTTPESHIESFSKSNPIYYEYFEAKRQQGAAPHIIDEFLSSTVKPLPTPSPKPVKLYATSKKPFKNSQAHRNYMQQPHAPNHRYENENVVVITPKPESRYKPRPIFKQRPLHNFEQEVSAIRETLRYYQNQELRDNNIPRTPKAKPVYEFNYDTSAKSVEPEVARHTFKPPLEFDQEPFQPMVTYSPPVDDLDSFRAVPVDKFDGSNVEAELQGREELEEPTYVGTTTLVPVQPQERGKKLRVGAKYLQQPQLQQQLQHQPLQHQPEFNTQPRWVAVQKQEFGVYTPPDSPPPYRERFPEPLIAQQQPQRNRDYPGYYYGPTRQNNRFYEEPFQNSPNRKIVNYRPPPPPPLPQQQQQQPIWSLENDTYVNYAPNRPPLNPDAEFINPYQTAPFSSYQQQQQRLTYPQSLQQQQQQQQQGVPPALSHQSQQYYAPQLQQSPQQQQQRLPGSRQYQPQPVSLHRDILVNYRQPLPPINPESEYISHPQVVRNPLPNPYYRANNYRLPQPPLASLPVTNLNIGGNGGGGGVGVGVPETDVYFLTPKYRRANNLNNSNNNNNNNNNHNPNQQRNPRPPHASNGK